MYDSLGSLTSAFGVPGHEGEIRKAILSNGKFEYHEVDNFGNLYCHNKAGEDAPTVLLDAHMDEIGFIVKHIDADGMIYLNPMGGIDPRCMIGNRLMVRGSEDIVGIVCNTPPHLSTEGKVPDIGDLPLDTGLTKRELEEIIYIGAPVGFLGELMKLSGTKVSSKGLDNRAGCLVLCELSKTLAANCNVTYLFSTQEEVGTRGVEVALKTMDPDLALCVDVTQGNMHFIKSPITRELGSGTIIGTGPNIHPKIFGSLVEHAKKENIPFSTKAYPKATPTNLRTIQLSGGGVPSGLLAIPLKYMHTPTEVIDINDITSTISLIRAFIDDVDDVIQEGFTFY